jgi:hypothetical protein
MKAHGNEEIVQRIGGRERTISHAGKVKEGREKIPYQGEKR